MLMTLFLFQLYMNFLAGKLRSTLLMFNLGSVKMASAYNFGIAATCPHRILESETRDPCRITKSCPHVDLSTLSSSRGDALARCGVKRSTNRVVVLHKVLESCEQFFFNNCLEQFGSL